MLSEIFVINRKGHLIFREEGLYSKDLGPQNYRQFHNFVGNTPDSPPYLQHGSTHYYQLQCEGLRWVAAAGRPLPALQVLGWLAALRDVVRTVCGAASESALRANHLAMRQLAGEIVEDGMMLALDAGRLRSLLLSRPQLGVVTPPAGPAGPQHNVYVDVVESVDCEVTCVGEVLRCEVTGRLEVRADGAAGSRLDVSLADDVRLLEADAPAEAHLGPQVNITRLHPSATLDGRRLGCPAGRLTLLEYRCCGQLPPVAFTGSAARVSDSADLRLLLRLRLVAGAERCAPSLGVRFAAPPGMGAVSALCGGAGEGAVRHDREAEMVVWSVRELGGTQEATAELRLTDAAPAGTTPCVGPFRLSWEVSDLTVSGLRVAGVRLAGLPDGRVRRWVRHAAVSGTHTAQAVEVGGGTPEGG